MAADTNYSDKISHLLNYHFKISNSVPLDETSAAGAVFDPVTLDEVTFSINSQSNDKAPGPDGLGPRYVKLLLTYISNLIVMLYNKLFGLGYFPKAWKVAKVVFINKPGKDPRSPKSYRPVCLLQTISKSF